MKIALVADLHVHAWAEHSVDEGGIPSRLHHTVSVLADIRMHCNAHGIGVVVIAGDLFHKRGVVYTQAYHLVVEQLAQMRRDGITVLCVEGNHDQANKAGTVHAIQALSGADLVEGVPACGWVNWILNDELVVTGFPYCDDRALLWARMEAAEADYRKYHDGVHRIGVFHHGFKGARVGSALEYVVKEDIDPAAVSAYDFAHVFSGHYHQRQALTAHMSYIGSPLEFVRGDGGQDKGFLVYDSKARDYTLIALDRPRFVKLDQALIDTGDRDAWQEIAQGNFVDVVYEKLPAALDEAWLRRVGAAGVKLVSIKRVAATATARLAVDPSMSATTILEKYLEYRKADVEKMDRAALLRTGFELFEKASK